MNIFDKGLLNLLSESGVIPVESAPYYLVFTLAVIICAVISYLLGSINSAIFFSKLLYKEDVRTQGSGNAGLTNMLRTYGKVGAALTLLGDMAKTALAVLITGLVFGFSYENGISLDGFCYLAGLCAVLGHVFPIFYGFKGGKGVLVTAVMALILCPPVFGALILLFIIIVAISGYVSLGSIIAASLFPFCVSLYSYFVGGDLHPLTVACSVILALFVIWCHRSNIKRLRDGNEKKISIGKRK